MNKTNSILLTKFSLFAGLLLLSMLVHANTVYGTLGWKHQVEGDTMRFDKPENACKKYLKSSSGYSGWYTVPYTGNIGWPQYHMPSGDGYKYIGYSSGGIANNPEKRMCHAIHKTLGDRTGGYVYLILRDTTADPSTITCPDGFTYNKKSSSCIKPPKQPHDQCSGVEKTQLGTTASNKGPNPTAGNPIIVATGNKHETEVDYKGQSPFGLSFVRIYNSAGLSVDNGTGLKWNHNFNTRLEESFSTEVVVYRSNGQAFTFSFDGFSWNGEVDVPDSLLELVDSGGVRTGWEYRDSQDNIETYNTTGQLVSITNRAGQTQTLDYTLTAANGGDDNPETLDKVIGFSGQVMTFTYDASNRINSMTDPNGQSYSYSYDSNGNLLTVVYPDETPSDSLDNPARTYHYENTNFPHHLTGITDETGNRYVTWEYGNLGRAISSVLAGGADSTSLDYSVTDQVTVTNPLGKQTTYHFTTLHGVKKVTQVEGHATTSCAAANKAYTYDANGYLASKTDWQGNVTTYVHDDRGLEVSRTEAAGTPEARTITTQWHTDFRLPIQITEPGKVTNFTYDAQGRLIRKEINTQQ